MKKITRATFKIFINKNKDRLLIKYQASFDGMTDCVEYKHEKDCKFMPLKRKTLSEMDYLIAKRERGINKEELNADLLNNENNLGYEGIWLTSRKGNDHFMPYEDEKYMGIRVFNCCGEFTVAIEKSI